MNYHNITYPDQNNGDGLRVVLWLSGCNHHCKNCQNPQTWDENSGILFDDNAKEEIFEQLNNDYISGITISGGDPLHDNNVEEVLNLLTEIRNRYGFNKSIWIYTGYTVNVKLYPLYDKNYEQDFMSSLIVEPIVGDKAPYTLYRQAVLNNADVVVDGRFVNELKDLSLEFRGSANQRVIDVKKSLEENKIITLY